MLLADLSKMRMSALTRHDVTLIGILGVLAACGLIYEYILAHYAGRILGSLESTIYTMIGLMIVSMGIGAFLANTIKDAFTGFAWLESCIGIIGSLSIPVMAAIYALSYTLPDQLNHLYGVHHSIPVGGNIPLFLSTLAGLIPYVTGFVLGLLVGMEIPLIARVRTHVHKKHLEHNFGTMYGADYIGAGIGAAIWIIFCLSAPILMVALYTALANVIIGMTFLYIYQKDIKGAVILWPIHIVVLAFIGIMILQGDRWVSSLNDMLYKDTVMYSELSEFQNIVITKQTVSAKTPTVYKLFLNNKLQFSSADEKIYHAMLTYPALLASARQEHILVVGGGDGLATRDILKWNPKTVTLLELDPKMIALFSGNSQNEQLNNVVKELNEESLQDPRLTIIYGDAFVNVRKLLAEEKHFDTIIVDLPDPSHPDLNKLYSDVFYANLKTLLNGDGAIAIQSSSPYHSKEAFISVGKTLEKVDFITQQYHTNVPSFGEWGWTIGTVRGKSASLRIEEAPLSVVNSWISKNQLLAAFSFSPDYFDNRERIEANGSDSHTIYRYHHDAWVKNKGIFYYK